MLNKNIQTFIGCEAEYSESSAVIFGVPFDGTASYRPGTRFAPSAVRNESYSIETYSPYLDRDLCSIRVFDGGDLELPFGSPEKVLSIIEQYTAGILADGKLPCMIGGEHLCSLGAVRAAAKKYDELFILHFDAHADLRDDYLGEKLSHATVMRRCWEITGDGSIFQFGIRSGERDEFLFAAKHINMNRFDLSGINDAVAIIGQAPVYLTVDLDVLDPSELPGTGTPEAGGVGFIDLIRAVKAISGLNIIGMDMCELSPTYDQSGISTSLACKLLREMLLSVVKD